MPLTGCMSNGLDLGLGRAPDRSVVTGSIPDFPALLSDDDVMRDAVASADVKKGSLHTIPWMNPGTGNNGIVSYVGEKRTVREICREFVASKHSYDGISQYHGNICRSRMGKSWAVKSIEKQG